MKFLIFYSDNSTDLVDASDHIEVKSTSSRTYAIIDGEMYGNDGPHDITRVTLARSEEGNL